MKTLLRWYDYITINIYWFALTARSQTLTPLVIPLLVQQFVGEEMKGTYVGRMRLWSLMVALLMQALMGLLSDRSTSRFGRRRPFIVVGALSEVVVFICVGFTTGLSGMVGYWVLFVLYNLSMVSSNTAHAATQALIPDLVPEDLRGRASGIKALLELPIPLVFSSFVVGRMMAAGDLWGALIALCLVLIGCMVIALFARETPLAQAPPPLDWQPFVRLLLMTGAFTLIILGTGAVVNMGMRGLSASMPNAKLITGGLGLIGMGAAVGVGIWVSVYLSIGDAIKEQHNFVWWVMNRLAFFIASTNLAGFMLYFLQERFVDLQGEKAAGPASDIIMFVGIFIIVSALASSWLVDRFGKKRLVAVSGALGAIGTLIVILAPALAGVKIGASVVGLGIGLFYSANWALGTEIIPKDQAGRYLGLGNLAGAGAGAIGAYIGGPIADDSGYVILFAIYAVMFVLSVVVLQGIKETW